MEKLRICLYCDHWQNGGVESFLMNCLRHWPLQAAKCVLVTSDKTTNIYDAELEALGIQHDVTLTKVYTSPIMRILKNFNAFREYLESNHFDVLYLNVGNSITMAYAHFAAKAGVRSRVVHSHCAGIQKGFGRPLKLCAHFLIRRVSYKYCTTYLASSDKAADWLFPTKQRGLATILLNGIEIDRFTFSNNERVTCRKHLNLKDSFVVGTVGRMSPEKNQAFLLDVFAKFYKQHKRTALLLVGDGPERQKLEVKAKELGIYEVCLFTGFTDNVAPYYMAMDVFCLPSYFEGNGIVAIEAQTSGLACVLSDTIPQNAKVLSETRMESLQNAGVWAKALMEISAKTNNRSTAANLVKAAGYDICTTSRQVWEILQDTPTGNG